jgi:hypothetical protein
MRIATLVMTNSTAGNATAAPVYTLDASTHNHTSMFLVVASPTPNVMKSLSEVESPSDVPVQVQMDVFDAKNAAIEAWCATYNATPEGSSQINVERCREQGLEDEHKSQVSFYFTLDVFVF